jgi:hypothetical protein
VDHRLVMVTARQLQACLVQARRLVPLRVRIPQLLSNLTWADCVVCMVGFVTHGGLAIQAS